MSHGTLDENEATTDLSPWKSPLQTAKKADLFFGKVNEWFGRQTHEELKVKELTVGGQKYESISAKPRWSVFLSSYQFFPDVVALYVNVANQHHFFKQTHAQNEAFLHLKMQLHYKVLAFTRVSLHYQIINVQPTNLVWKANVILGFKCSPLPTSRQFG